MMRLKTIARVAACAALFAAGYSGNARADSFNFTFQDTGGQIIADGTITTGGPFINGMASVTGITGMYNGFAITGLLPNNTEGFGTDNILYSTAPYVDTLGIIFGTTDDSTVANVFFRNGHNELGSCTNTVFQARQCFDGSPNLTDFIGTLSVTQTPEPATLTLLATGLGFGLLRRRSAARA